MMIHKIQFSPLVFLVFFLIGCQTKPASEIYGDNDTSKQFSLLSPDLTGVTFENRLSESEVHNHLVDDQFITGGGVAIGDINNDGLADLFFSGNQVADRLYLNKGNLVFQDITEAAGIKIDKTWSRGVTFADVNNDGWLDLYICKNIVGQNELSANHLYINKGDMTFEEQGEAYGLADKGFSVQATFFDFDKDGWLDMYLVNQPPSIGNRRGGKIDPYEYINLLYSDKIYKNMGDGTFVDASDFTQVRNFAYGLAAMVGDYNHDGWPDIYVANDFDLPDHLYISQGDGRYVNRINQAVKHMSNFSMGVDAADYDNDGLLDIMVLDMVAEDHKRIKTFMGGMNPDDFWDVVKKGWHYQYMFNTLQRNNGNGTFAELAHMGGVSNTDWSWGPLFADFDNDGYKDLFVTNGVRRNMRHGDLDKIYTKVLDSVEIEAKNQGKKIKDFINIMEFVEMAPVDKFPNYIFKNNGDLTFKKMVAAWGFDLPTLSNGAGYADLDNDGDIDLIINNIDDHAYIYRNNNNTHKNRNFIRLLVQNEQGGFDYGAHVKIFKDKKLWQFQELSNTRGYMSKSEDILHFGLGEEIQVEKVEITFNDGKVQILENVVANQVITVNHREATPNEHMPTKGKPLFVDVTTQVGIDFVHKENNFDDYEREPLLPHKMSNFGPGLAVGDVNGDGLEDFYVGGATGFAGVLYLQNPNGTFKRDIQPIWETDKFHEDLGAVFFDADDDQDPDLYVVSGGNEFELTDKALLDRLYINDGKGNFKLAMNRLPAIFNSGSCVVPGDYDSDGDLDLFVGGRLVPGKYPLPADSHILQNDEGFFKDVTMEILPELTKLGMVTSAVWTDVDNDNLPDLVVVGEWMTINVFKNTGATFRNITKETGLADASGWYYKVIAEDFDKDGDNDLVVGNLGLNYKYKASPSAPFEVFSDDFDQNGRLDIVLSYYEHGELVPVRGRSCSSQQIPVIKEKFPTFEAFGEADLEDIYGRDLETALNYKATNFASAYVENLGNGQFKLMALPNEAQISSINGIVADDFNDDGHLDMLVAGNLYASEIETPRNDANMGLFLMGDGAGNFTPIPLASSGFFAPHDAKDMKMLGFGRQNEKMILVANNRYNLQAILHQSIHAGDFGNEKLLTLK